MAFIIEEETGNITLVQGDSGIYPVEDVPNDRHYTAYFGIYNDKRKSVGFEVTCDVPAYNAGQPIYDKDLFCFSYSDNNLYTANNSPEIDDVLYNSDNEETEYTVTGIKSITTVNGTFQRNSENDLNEYHIDLYAWGDTSLYTESLDVKVNDVLLDSEGTATANTVTSINSIIINHNEYTRNSNNDISEYGDTLLYAWFTGGRQITDNGFVYTTTATPQVGDFLLDKNSNRIAVGRGEWAKIGEISNTQITIISSNSENPVGFVAYGIRGEDYDIKEIIGTNAYAWTLDNFSVYTLTENPEIGDKTCTIDLEEDEEITEIGSFKVSTDIYNRNFNNDVKTFIRKIAYAWSNITNTIFTLTENPKIADNIYDYEVEISGIISGIGSILIGLNEYLRNPENDIKKTEVPDPPPTTNIEFKIPAALTNHLTVKRNEETAEYYFGIKLCSDDEDEDTLLLGNSNIGDLNTITVYPKKLEGTINNG